MIVVNPHIGHRVMDGACNRDMAVWPMIEIGAVIQSTKQGLTIYSIAIYGNQDIPIQIIMGLLWAERNAIHPSG